MTPVHPAALCPVLGPALAGVGARGLLRRWIVRGLLTLAVTSGTGATQLTLTWADNSDNELGFVLQRRSLGGSYADLATTRANVTSYTDIGLVPGETYVYRVRAYNASGASYHSRAASGVAAAAAAAGLPPTLSPISARAVAVNESTAPIPIEVGDAVAPAGTLVVTASSSDPVLFPASNLVLGGAGGSRSLVAIPARDRSGSAAITIVVSNGSRSVSESFVLTVGNAVPIDVSSLSRVSTHRGERLFFGAVGTQGGRFGLLVRPDRSALLIAQAASFPQGALVVRLNLAENGEFSTEVAGLGTLRGKVTHVMVSGVMGASGLPFAGTQEPLSGVSGVQAGYFRGVLTGTAEGQVHALIGASGQSMVAAHLDSRSFPMAAAGVVDSEGRLDVTLEEGNSLQLAIRPDRAVLAGRWQAGPQTWIVRGGHSDLPSDGRLVNLSVRARTGAGANAMIAGFTVSGVGSRPLLLRAVGPTLGLFGVEGVLPNPALSLRQQGSPQDDPPYAANDDWAWMDVAPTAFAAAAFPLQSGSLDAALHLPLPVGGYSAQITDAGDGEGVALMELYDADVNPLAGAARLSNLSIRSRVANGEDVIVAGFAVSGDLPKRLLLRAIGPELTAFGVPGALSDPTLTLFRSDQGESTPIASNNDVNPFDSATSSVTSFLGAFPLGNASRSSALVVWVEAGVYTVRVRSAIGTPGVVLLELYEVPEW